METFRKNVLSRYWDIIVVTDSPAIVQKISASFHQDNVMIVPRQQPGFEIIEKRTPIAVADGEIILVNKSQKVLLKDTIAGQNHKDLVMKINSALKKEFDAEFMANYS